MCIIAAKTKSGRIPTIEELTNCFNNNHDGAGFMYCDNNNKVIIDKGYMTLKSFIKHYKKLLKKYNNFENKALVIHCRIGTASANSRENTHPYTITNNKNILHTTLLYNQNIGIAHNGIISAYNPTLAEADINDTQKFIINYLQPLYKNYKDFFKNKYIMQGIKTITNSKFAILQNNEIYLIGDFEEEANGLYFSNTTYKNYKTTYNWNDWRNWKDWKDYDDYYDGYYIKKEEKEKAEDGDAVILEYNDFIYDDITGDFIQVKELKKDNILLYYPDTGVILEQINNGEYKTLYERAQCYDVNYVEIY